MAFPWNDQWQADLAQMANDGLTAGEMAKILSRKSGYPLTRNGAIGRLHRTKLWPTKAAPPGPRQTRPKRKRAARPRSKPVRIKPALIAPVVAAAASPALPVGPPAVNACSILEISGKRCRWPVAEWPPFRCQPLDPIFCGAEKADDGNPYCAAHARMAFTAPPVRKREAA